MKTRNLGKHLKLVIIIKNGKALGNKKPYKFINERTGYIEMQCFNFFTKGIERVLCNFVNHISKSLINEHKYK